MGHYERNDQRRGRANGYQSKRLQTEVGEVTVAVLKTWEHLPGQVFYPAAVTRWRRGTRAVAAVVAEMYFNGVSTQRMAKVL